MEYVMKFSTELEKYSHPSIKYKYPAEKFIIQYYYHSSTEITK